MNRKKRVKKWLQRIQNGKPCGPLATLSCEAASRRDIRKPEDCVLHPGQDERNECEDQQRDQDRRTDPNSKMPIIRIIDRAMCLIEIIISIPK